MVKIHLLHDTVENIIRSEINFKISNGNMEFNGARYNYSTYFDMTKELSLTGKTASGGGFHNFKSWRSIRFSEGGAIRKTK